TTVQPTIKDTPFFLMFGRDARIPAELFFGDPSFEEDQKDADSGVDEDEILAAYMTLGDETEASEAPADAPAEGAEQAKPEVQAAVNVPEPEPSGSEPRVAIWMVKNMGSALRTMLSKLFSHPATLPPNETIGLIMDRFNLDALYIVHDRLNDSARGKVPMWPQFITEDERAFGFEIRTKDCHLLIRIYTKKGFKLTMRPNSDSYWLTHDARLYRGPKMVYDPHGSIPFRGRPLWPSTGSPPTLVTLEEDTALAAVDDLDTEEDEFFPLLAPLETGVCYAVTQWDKDLAKLLKANPTVGIADFAVELTNRLRIARGLAAENIRRAQDHMAERSAENDREYDFKEGDRVWLAVPLRPATGELRNTKFLFKWAGPMRIVGREGEKFKLIEVIPGGSIIPRIANRGRMRPYTQRRPVDKAEKAAAEAADDYEQELEKWLKDFNVLYKRPPGREEASGVNRWFRQRFDEDYDPELDLDDPQYEIEKITK
ncbi:hypothetical protein HDU96_004229, partial [Phlyctochytrium bullatum]